MKYALAIFILITIGILLLILWAVYTYMPEGGWRKFTSSAVCALFGGFITAAFNHFKQEWRQERAAKKSKQHN